jgi:hypothetical protein
MPRAGQQFAVLVLSHLFPALFYDTTQWITSFPGNKNDFLPLL